MVTSKLYVFNGNGIEHEFYELFVILLNIDKKVTMNIDNVNDLVQFIFRFDELDSQYCTVFGLKP